jgi:hypothetical protein
MVGKSECTCIEVRLLLSFGMIWHFFVVCFCIYKLGMLFSDTL